MYQRNREEDYQDKITEVQDNNLHHKYFYMQNLLHTDIFLQTNTFYTQKLLHTKAFTHKSFHTQRILHRCFYRQTLLHTEKITHGHFQQTASLFHTGAFTHRSVCTQTPHRPVFFARKGCSSTTKAQFYSSFCASPSFGAKGFFEHKETIFLPQLLRTQHQFLRKGLLQ